MISRRIGRYEIDRLLGEGGVGRVYAAHDTLLGRQVAIKTLRPEASRNREFIDRFLNEAKSFSDLKHPNITGLYDLDLEAQPPHMVMELVEGHTLEDLLLECGRLPPRECLAVVSQVAAGLSAAHRKGVIHRDIKPSNLMVTESGLLKIMDFGIARVRGSQRLTRADQVYATLLYASPEQLRGSEVDERSDVYSLAAVTHEMLSGSPPFTADTDADLRMAQLEAQPPPLAPLVSGLNPRIEAGVLRALAKHPRDRFATVEQFAEAIGASAIRRDAADILHGYLRPLLHRVSEPQQTRLVSVASGEPVPAGVTTLRGNEANNDGSLAIGERALRSTPGIPSMRRPIAVLGAATFAVLLGGGYVAWSLRTPSPSNLLSTSQNNARPEKSPQTTVERPRKASDTVPVVGIREAPPSPSTLKDKVVSVVSPERPTSQDVRTPETSVKDIPTPPKSDISTEARSEESPGPRVSDDKVAVADPPMPRPPNPSKLDPASMQVPPPMRHRYPEGAADLEGTITNYGSADWIFINGRQVKLFGIEDNAKNPTELRDHQNLIAGYLHRGQTYVVCYKRPENSYRCYTENENIADLALNSRIAKRSGGTP